MKCLLIIPFFIPLLLTAQLRFSLESGAVATEYNDVRVPNGDQNTGTLFSFSDDFADEGSSLFIRSELRYLIKDKHSLEVTAAPLTRRYSITIDEAIDFAESRFQGPDVEGSYKFNTYRLSYRYRIVSRPQFTFDLGASLLVRDAKIALFQGFITSDDSDLGYVPLVSFELDYSPSSQLSLILKGDALVGPVGRAEDIFIGALYRIFNDNVSLKAGYRIIEGGADVDQVYNFALFHFLDFGIVVTL